MCIRDRYNKDAYDGKERVLEICYTDLKHTYQIKLDDRGSAVSYTHLDVYKRQGTIGKRYRRQDEIGTPFCVTYDFDSEEDHCVTVRDRDTICLLYTSRCV